MVFDIPLMHDIRFDLVGTAWDADGPEWTDEVLVPWLRRRDDLAAGLAEIGAPAMVDVPLDQEDRWVGYAVSRVVDLVTFPAQPPGDAARFGSGPLIGAGAYPRLIEELGGWWPEVSEFLPFLHEIAAIVEDPDPDAEPTLVAQQWPGFFVGAMLMARAGVTVRAGRHRLRPDMAASSPMYWAWIRRYRPSHDLSHGWGSNSQWRTDFRRDYVVDGVLHYNVGARWRQPLSDPPESGPDDLIRHRCDVLVEADEEWWPWDTYLTEPAPAWLLSAMDSR